MSYSDFINHFPHYSLLESLFKANLMFHRRWEKGQYLCRMDSELTDLIFLTSGRGKVYRNLSNGKEVLFKLYGPGDVAGDVEFILKQKASCSLVSSQGLAGYVLPTHSIPPEIFPKLFSLMAREVAEKLVASSTQQALRLGYSLQERLVYHLLYEYSGEYSSMEELAAMMGTSYRHLSRVFQLFSRKGLLVLEKKRVTLLDREALEEMCVDIREDQ